MSNEFSLAEILDTLEEGNTLQFKFPTKAEALQFQYRLGSYKTRIDRRREKENDRLVEIGSAPIYNFMTLSMSYNLEEQIAAFKLNPKGTRNTNKPAVKFEVLAVLPPSDNT